MPPKTEQEFWSGQTDARLGNVERQVEAIWVRMGAVGEDVTEVKLGIGRVETMLGGLPARVQSLEETRAKGRGAWVVLSLMAGFLGTWIKSLIVKQ